MLLTLSLSLSAQIIERTFQNTNFSITTAVEFKENIFIVESECLNFSTNCNARYLYKLNQNNLNTIDSIDLNVVLGLPQNLRVDDLKVLYDTNLVLILSRFVPFNQGSSFNKAHSLIAIFDTLLNLKNTIFPISPLDSLDVFLFRSHPFFGDVLFAGATLADTITGSLDGIVIRMDLLGNQKGFGVIPSDSVPIATAAPGIFDLMVTDSFVFATIKHDLNDLNIARFNSNLDLLSLESLTDFPNFDAYLTGGLNFQTFDNDKRIFIYGISNHFVFRLPPLRPIIESLSLIEIDSLGFFHSMDTFAFVGSDLLWNGLFISNDTWINSISAISPDSVIFWASDLNLFQGFSWPYKFANRIFIYNVNVNNMQVNWHRVYSPGYSIYGVGLQALPGNRYLLAFNEFDWHINPNDHQKIRLVILDETGGFVSDNGHQPPPNLVVYPNPANDWLAISGLNWQQHKYYNIELLDATGAVVKKVQLFENDRIPVQGLAKGVYQLLVTEADGWGWVTKVVIE